MWSRFGEPGSVLPPRHASVFFDALRYLSDVVGWEDWEAEGWVTGIAVFDQLTQGQKQVALLEAACALLQAGAKPAASGKEAGGQRRAALGLALFLVRLLREGRRWQSGRKKLSLPYTV